MMWTSRPWVFKRLAARGAVRDPLAGQPVEPVDRQLPPGDSAGQDDRPRAQDVTAVEVELTARDVQPLDRAGHEDLGAEPARLLERAARQLVAGHARGEAEVILDPRGGAGLAAGRLALDDDRAQALRGSVHGRRQARGARADDHRVVLGGGGLGAEAEQLGHPSQARSHHGLAVDDADRRQVPVGRHRAAPPVRPVRRVGREPRERDLVALQEAPQLRAGRIPAMPDHDRARRWAARPPGPAARATHPSGEPRACRPPVRRRAPRPRGRGSRSPRAA